jgi:hypothetical protein
MRRKTRHGRFSPFALRLHPFLCAAQLWGLTDAKLVEIHKSLKELTE